jgi:hypothetical protein
MATGRARQLQVHLGNGLMIEVPPVLLASRALNYQHEQHRSSVALLQL